MKDIKLAVLPAGDRIEPMTETDLPLVHTLECASQQNPWSQKHFLDELNNPVAKLDLYWHGEELAGFLCSWLIAGEMQIQNVVTSPAMRRQRIAIKLLQHAIERNSEELSSIFLEVRAGNKAAIELYEKMGFVESGIRPNYYPDGEDALLMTCTKVLTI